MSITTKTLPPIIIIGTGLSGLTLAQGLQTRKIPFEIYERDPSSSTRSQGYRIRLHDKGLESLRWTVGERLYEQVERSCAKSSEGMRRFDAISGGDFVPPQPPSLGGNRPGPPRYQKSLPADRTTLRKVLSRGLEDSINYGKTFDSYTETPQGIIAKFKDGTSSSEGSLLIGADGRSSSVSKSYLGDLLRPHDLKQPMIYGKTPLNSTTRSKIDDRLIGGLRIVSTTIDDNPIFLFLESMTFESTSEDKPEDYIYWVLSAHESVFNKISPSPNTENSSQISQKLTEKWYQPLRSVIELQETTSTAYLRMTTAHPTSIPFYPSNKRITLMGDAFHTMPPAGGNGANVALRDAATLFRFLCEDENGLESGDWSLAVEGYEREMRGYAQVAVGEAYRAAVGPFGVRPLDL